MAVFLLMSTGTWAWNAHGEDVAQQSLQSGVADVHDAGSWHDDDDHCGHASAHFTGITTGEIPPAVTRSNAIPEGRHMAVSPSPRQALFRPPIA